MSGKIVELTPVVVEPVRPVTAVIACRRRLIALGLESVLSSYPEITCAGIAIAPGVLEGYLARERVDVVLCAWREYGAHAASLFDKITREHPDTRICVIADEPDPAIIREAMLQGATGFISEACSDDQIIDALLAVGNGRTAIETGPLRSYSERAIEGLISVDVLTDREKDVLTLIAVGLSTKEIANALFLSPKTVETHRSNLMRKLDLNSIAEVTLYASRIGLVGTEPPAP